MPSIPTADEWLRQSSLLLKARPSTTRITTKYNIPDPSKAPSCKRKTRDDEAEPKEPTAPPATLTLKAYDPSSGACLTYNTNKGWEVGRLIASLGRLGRQMAALPEVVEGTLPQSEAIKKSGIIDDERSVNVLIDTATLDVADIKAEGGSGTHTPVPEAAKPAAAEVKTGQGGGGKKKKRGKR